MVFSFRINYNKTYGISKRQINIMTSKEFDSFEDAKKYAKLNSGSTIVRQIKYCVKLNSEKDVSTSEIHSEEKLQYNQKTELKTYPSDIFKLESYQMVRLIDRLWEGKIDDIQTIRRDNQQNGRLLNHGLPLTLEEIELFNQWISQQKDKNELINFFQRKMDDIPQMVKKNKERLARGYREYYWNDEANIKIDLIPDIVILSSNDFSKVINKLQKLIHESLNFEEILSYGAENLQHLEISLTNSIGFTEDDRKLLYDLTEKFNYIKIFNDELEDIKYMQYKDEFEESIGKFYEVLKILDGLEISKIILKEIRELMIKKDSSISSIKAKQEKTLASGINALNENRPICKKCENKMVIRKGENIYFWGCSTFPSCFGRKWFTKKELQMIEGV